MKKYDKNEDFIIYPLLQGLGMPHCCFGNIPETPLGFKRFPGTLRLYWTPRTAMSKLGGPRSVVKLLNFLSFHYLK